ncbi:hypothetical protein EZ449_03780 [Pedobacter frigidisoli]|uniref:Uncharacterized protein n=1 Tax=Pedobacter frigidisoli TaxID=2530455 RepID=A0A4R0PB86_9SPHI|nr:hypothetical protein [Pedobacter frigidisoli]TCD12145.1 hypothetical protein EZ449_03780 [Pedobacter frigidisoli]
MENQENNQEEIQNIAQFQVGRANGNAPDGHPAKESEEYTEDEIPFADGEGTQLNEEIGGPDDEEDDDESAETNDESVEDQEYNESDVEELDNDPNAYDKVDGEML